MSLASVPLASVTARPTADEPFSASEAGGLSTGAGTGKRCLLYTSDAADE